jgi:hypothetical protein
MSEIHRVSARAFFRQTIAVLLACGLIAGLLPGLAAAQDKSRNVDEQGGLPPACPRVTAWPTIGRA